MEALRIIVYVAIIILSIAAIKTVFPNANASKPCLLGYKATCSFAPISTIILVVAAIAVFLGTKGILA
jgi:hypothetical protein